MNATVECKDGSHVWPWNLRLDNHTSALCQCGQAIQERVDEDGKFSIWGYLVTDAPDPTHTGNPKSQGSCDTLGA